MRGFVDVETAALSEFCGKVKVLGYILHRPSQRFVLACKPVAAPGKNSAKKLAFLCE